MKFLQKLKRAPATTYLLQVLACFLACAAFAWYVGYDVIYRSRDNLNWLPPAILVSLVAPLFLRLIVNTRPK